MRNKIDANIKALLLAGGSGTRLWPLSTETDPKQFHSLGGERSLMTETVHRVSPLIEARDIWIVANSTYSDKIAAHSPGVPREQILKEPFPLGTNLAVGLGILHILRKDPEAVVVIGWTDSYIGDPNEFCKALRLATEAVSVTNGVIIAAPATYASDQYGYIEAGEPLSGIRGAFSIAHFEEKPTRARAADLLASKNYFWNSGISVWKASALLALIQKHTPEHFAALQMVGDSIGTRHEASKMREVFKGLDPIAIDRAIFEKAESLAVIPAELDWSDIGSWCAVYDVRPKSPEGNVVCGPVVTIDTDDCLIYAQNRPIAMLGVSNLLVIETDDVLVIVNKDDAERIAELRLKVKELRD